MRKLNEQFQWRQPTKKDKNPNESEILQTILTRREGGKTNGKHVGKWNAKERKNAFYADEFIV